MKELEENSEVIWIEKDEYIQKPFENEHACRLKNPDDFTSFARVNCQQKVDDKCIDVIFGIKEGKSEIQALRYPKDVWTAESARAHCKDRGGTFEAASKSLQQTITTFKELIAKNKDNCKVYEEILEVLELLNKTPDQSVVEESGEDAAISFEDIEVEKSDPATATSDGDEAEIIIVED